MKIAHIFGPNGYLITESYIKFVRENFKTDIHDFIVIGNDLDRSINSFPTGLTGVKYFCSYKKNINQIIQLLKLYNKIIFHSLSMPIKTQIKFLINHDLMKKIYWIAWGYDLYQWRLESVNLKNIVANQISFLFRKKIKYFIGIFPPDIDHFIKQFNSNAETFYASYTGNLYNSFYKKKLKLNTIGEKNENNECINIQIGHSSTKVLNHADVLTKLEKYKNKNIKIFIPLAYGDMNYGDSIQKLANEIFGEKAICMREIIPKDKYMEHLSTMDIVIFNTIRQIGLGNISPLLFMEKKIFMPKGSVMYEFYKSQGIDIWDYNEIQELDYSKFVSPIFVNGGRDYIENNELNLDKKIKMWNRVFET